MTREEQVKAIVDALERVDDESCVYLNLDTGEMEYFTEEILSAAEELEEDPPDEGQSSNWFGEAVREAREVVDSDRWVTLPSKYELNDYRVMRNFCLEVEDEGFRDELLNAISGRGAFRWFRDLVRRRGVEKEWFGFREAARGRIALEWLEDNGFTDPDERQIRFRHDG